MRIEFVTPKNLIMGRGKKSELASSSMALGKRPVVIKDESSRHISDLLDNLEEMTSVYSFRTAHRPSFEDAIRVGEQARTHQCDHVIAIGSGETIDLAKCAALTLNDADFTLEDFGALKPGHTLNHSPAALLAMPIEAGCGTESSDDARLFCERLRRPMTVRHHALLPETSLVDPALHVVTSPETTATRGLRALCRLVEAMITSDHGALHEALCAEGIRKIGKNLQQAYHHGHDTTARSRIAIGSYYAGLARSNSSSRFVQEMSAPVSELFHAPIGDVSAILLPVFCENIIHLQQDKGILGPMADKLNTIARIFTENPESNADEILLWLQELCEHMMIPGLQDYGMKQKDIPRIIRAIRESQTDTRLINASDETLYHILSNALHPPITGEATLYM